MRVPLCECVCVCVCECVHVCALRMVSPDDILCYRNTQLLLLLLKLLCNSWVVRLMFQEGLRCICASVSGFILLHLMTPIVSSSVTK